MWNGGKVTKFKQDEYTFTIRQFAPFKGIKVLGDLQRLISPALGGALEGLRKSPNANTEDWGTLIPVISEALKQIAIGLDGDKLQLAMELLLDKDYVSVEVTSKDGKKIFTELDESLINEIFTGRVFELLALMFEVFKVNYLDFSKLSRMLGGNLGAFGEVKSKFQVN